MAFEIPPFGFFIRPDVELFEDWLLALFEGAEG